MKPRGVKRVFQDEMGRFIAVCNDGTMWITLNLDGLGQAQWKQINPVPKQ